MGHYQKLPEQCLGKILLHTIEQSFGYQVARSKVEGWGYPDVARCASVESY